MWHMPEKKPNKFKLVIFKKLTDIFNYTIIFSYLPQQNFMRGQGLHKIVDCLRNESADPLFFFPYKTEKAFSAQQMEPKKGPGSVHAILDNYSVYQTHKSGKWVSTFHTLLANSWFNSSLLFLIKHFPSQLHRTPSSFS